MHQRNERLIQNKVWKYLLPGIMMSMALQLGNIVDTIFVGNFLGTDAMSAITLVLPMETLIQVTGYCLGTGGSIAAGILLGKRNKEGASQLFTLTLLITVVVGLIIAAAAPFLAMPIADALAKGGSLSVPAGHYLFVGMLGAPVIGVGLLMSSFLGVENHPELASAYLIVSNVINLILDYIFLRFTSLGIAGASLSTVAGFLLGMVIFVLYIRSPKRMISFVRIQSFAPLREAVISGAPLFVFMVMTIIKSFVLNEIIIRIIGDGGMAVYTVCDNVLMIVEMITAGIIGVIPNIAGILYGEKDYFCIRALCKRVLVLSAAATACIFVLVMAFARSITVMFGVDDPALSSMMEVALRIFILCLPAYVWNKFLVGYYESIEESKQASVITFFQNGIYVLPAAALGIILEIKMGGSGMNGLALSFVCSEILTVLTAYIYRRIRHKNMDFYLLPEETGTCFDFTVKADMDETALVPREVKEFCMDNGVSANRANIVAVAAEEMIVNCIQYGGRQSHWIDVSLVIEQQKMLLRIRDNGVPFNPTEYEFDSGKFDIHGIELVKAIASEISYMRTMDLNNTVLNFDMEQEEEN
ncbi:MAG: ATP-binding protein [Lachnospiraceae bacterium]|nr:ATP-binding protein [Lachnospiraceae bacterium]